MMDKRVYPLLLSAQVDRIGSAFSDYTRLLHTHQYLVVQHFAKRNTR